MYHLLNEVHHIIKCLEFKAMFQIAKSKGWIDDKLINMDIIIIT